MQTKDVDEHSCPAAACFELLGQKWTAYLVWALQGGARRFSELIVATPGLSDRMLSVRLKSLERAGIVTRRQYEQIPPRVEYALTDRGHDLAPAIREMERWSARWPARDSSVVAGGGSQGATGRRGTPGVADKAAVAQIQRRPGARIVS